MADEKVSKSPSLDMNHGFVHSIIKNQIDRDEYDKEQKLYKLQRERKSAEHATKEERRRKEKRAPLHQVYIPPHQRKQLTSPEKTFEQQTTHSPELLLRLEFEGKDGGLNHLDIYKGDDIKKSVRIFAAKCNLDPRLKDALYYRITQELRDL